MNTELKKAFNWAKNNGLSFSEEKSVSMIFSNKRLPHCQKSEVVVLGNSKLNWVDRTNYLGIVLDNSLNWSAHIDHKLKEAKKKLVWMNNVIRKDIGPSPILSKWLYTGVIRPAFSYACLAWGHKLTIHRNKYQKCLVKLNRLSLLTLGNVRRSTPTSGLEIISGIMPLDLYILSVATKAHFRKSRLTS